MKKILIVGASSKLARRFLLTKGDEYKLYGTYNNIPPKTGKIMIQQYKLNLANVVSINTFTDTVASIVFDGLLFFASTYIADPQDKSDMTGRYQSDMFINSTSIAILAKNIHFQPGSKIIVLGDSGISLPKKGYTSYSLSKLALEDIIKLLAVDLAPNVSTICIKLGPTLTAYRGTEKELYYDRNLIKVKDPASGLINFINFLLNEPNFNSTGFIVNYDGGTYLRRIA